MPGEGGAQAGSVDEEGDRSAHETSDRSALHERASRPLFAARGLTAHSSATTRRWNRGQLIAAGVVEPTARYLIGDRWETTGARWGPAGAEAVLKLRALTANGLLDAYWSYHLARQHDRIHQTRYQDGYALAA